MGYLTFKATKSLKCDGHDSLMDVSGAQQTSYIHDIFSTVKVAGTPTGSMTT